MDMKEDQLQCFTGFSQKGSGIKSTSSQKLSDEPHKPIVRRFKRRIFKDNSWRADLDDMISKCRKVIRFLLCVLDFFNKYAWVIYLKDTIVNALQNILGNSKRKPNKTWVYQGSEFLPLPLKMVKRQ